MLRKRSSLSPLQHGSDLGWTSIPVDGGSAPAAPDQRSGLREHGGGGSAGRDGADSGDDAFKPPYGRSEQARHVPHASHEGAASLFAADDGWASELDDADWTGDTFWETDWREDEDNGPLPDPDWPAEPADEAGPMPAEDIWVDDPVGPADDVPLTFAGIDIL